ncbi:hypothetical protein J5J83_12200, partial [Azoarcus sp. L1K30]|uniref:hypothetical protein n=1 Tax=Azoarcus sp. L1K30 TaxID=2820277 RepID=UPI001B816C40
PLRLSETARRVRRALTALAAKAPASLWRGLPKTGSALPNLRDRNKSDQGQAKKSAVQLDVVIRMAGRQGIVFAMRFHVLSYRLRL